MSGSDVMQGEGSAFTCNVNKVLAEMGLTPSVSSLSAERRPMFVPKHSFWR